MIRARQLIDEGILGEPMSLRAAYLHSGYIDPNRPMSWGLDKKWGGGRALFDIRSHALDLVRFLPGDCREVLAATQTFVKQRPVAKGSSELVEVALESSEKGCWSAL